MKPQIEVNKKEDTPNQPCSCGCSCNCGCWTAYTKTKSE